VSLNVRSQPDRELLDIADNVAGFEPGTLAIEAARLSQHLFRQPRHAELMERRHQAMTTTLTDLGLVK
jgi:hypothetical protein